MIKAPAPTVKPTANRSAVPSILRWLYHKRYEKRKT